MKLRKIGIGLLVGCSLLVGCQKGETVITHEVISEEPAKEETNTLKLPNSHIQFKDMLSVEELRLLEGQEVTITGFIATSSPLHGEYVYLMNMPYQSCVFCLPNTTQLVNTMPVYAAKGKTIKFTDVPVTVKGILTFETKTDEVGYMYDYYIANATVEEADVTGLEEAIQTYTTLVDRGFGTKFQTIFEEMYARINYEVLEKEPTLIDLVLMEEIKSLFIGLDQSKYEDILAVVNDVECLMEEINTMILSEKFEDLEGLNEQGQMIYNDYYTWLVKPQI